MRRSEFMGLVTALALMSAGAGRADLPLYMLDVERFLPSTKRRVPLPPPPPPAPTCPPGAACPGAGYTVKPGDTLTGLASRLGKQAGCETGHWGSSGVLAWITAANSHQIGSSGWLREGQTLTLPGREGLCSGKEPDGVASGGFVQDGFDSPPAPGQHYRVPPGATLSELALLYRRPGQSVGEATEDLNQWLQARESNWFQTTRFEDQPDYPLPEIGEELYGLQAGEVLYLPSATEMGEFRRLANCHGRDIEVDAAGGRWCPSFCGDGREWDSNLGACLALPTESPLQTQEPAPVAPPAATAQTTILGFGSPDLGGYDDVIEPLRPGADFSGSGSPGDPGGYCDDTEFGALSHGSCAE